MGNRERHYQGGGQKGDRCMGNRSSFLLFARKGPDSKKWTKDKSVREWDDAGLRGKEGDRQGGTTGRWLWGPRISLPVAENKDSQGSSHIRDLLSRARITVMNSGLTPKGDSTTDGESKQCTKTGTFKRKARGMEKVVFLTCTNGGAFKQRSSKRGGRSPGNRSDTGRPVTQEQKRKFPDRSELRTANRKERMANEIGAQSLGMKSVPKPSTKLHKRLRK